MDHFVKQENIFQLSFRQKFYCKSCKWISNFLKSAAARFMKSCFFFWVIVNQMI